MTHKSRGRLVLGLTILFGGACVFTTAFGISAIAIAKAPALAADRLLIFSLDGWLALFSMLLMYMVARTSVRVSLDNRYHHHMDELYKQRLEWLEYRQVTRPPPYVAKSNVRSVQSGK
jgi:hypothetical protein